MQKIINVIALLSGLTSLGLIGGSSYLLLNKDALTEKVIKSASEAAIESVTTALPGMLESAMPEVPELPNSTGPAIPF